MKAYLTFKGKANREIHYRQWLPEGDIKGTVQLVHGMVEHMDRYDGFAEFLNSNGYAVYGHDHRGHGLTGTINGQVYFEENAGWEVVMSDVIRLSEIIEADHDVPHFLLGHSMGSYMTRGVLLQKSDYKGVILTGSGFISGIERVLFSTLLSFNLGGKGNDKPNEVLNSLLFGRSNDNFKPVRTEFDWLSKDEKNVDAYIEDPLCGQIPTTGFYKDLFKGITLACDSRKIKRIRKDIPLLVLTGADDPVAGENSRKASEMYKTHLSLVEFKAYIDCRHEILNEFNKEEIYQDIVDWIEK